jgi:hypothetical protein
MEAIMYRRIEVGIDGSPSSVHALDEAIQIAADELAELNCVHVIDLPFLLTTGGFYEPETLINALRRNGAAVLDNALRRALDAGVTCRTEMVETGSVTETIAAALCHQRRRVGCTTAGGRHARSSWVQPLYAWQRRDTGAAVLALSGARGAARYAARIRARDGGLRLRGTRVARMRR